MKLESIVPFGVALACWASVPLPAQDGTLDKVALRVTSTGPGPGAVVIDRGERDAVRRGDQVVLFPRDGGEFRGAVIQVDDRSAVVELHDRSFVPPAGTRGEVLIPRARLDRAVPPPVPPPGQQPGQPGQKPGQQQPGVEWQNPDEEWQPGMPLLAKVKPVRPAERRSRLTGNVYLIGALTQTRQDGFSNSFIRSGTDLDYRNPFGNGGGLRFFGELNYKTEVNDVSGADLLVQRLSYYWGGTRFESNGFEAGRFLQSGMPEFGVLDGFEWGHRFEDGGVFGASLGYMPEPNDDHESFKDFQIGVSYQWFADQTQQLSFAAGYQKSFHHSSTDRDLLVGRFRYVPPDAWQFNATAWVDFYFGDDNIKSGVDLTRMVASATRRWDDGDGLDLTYLHQRFPDIESNQFLPPLANEIADNRYDRLALTGWTWASPETRFHGHGGGWLDEDASGGFIEGGVDVRNLFLDRSLADVTMFGTVGQFSKGVGVRVAYGRFTDDGRWDVMYEIADYHQDNFPSDQDDVLQQRIRASREIYLASGWSFSFQAGADFWDRDWAWTLGIYSQKSF